MISIIKEILCFQLSLACVEASETPKHFDSVSDLPQIPFEVYYADYDKTVHVVAGCDKVKGSVRLTFKSTDDRISSIVYAAVNKAFDQPGVTKIQICRKG